MVTARVPPAEPCGGIWAPGRLPPTKPLWHTDHFELRLLKKCPTNRGTHPSVSWKKKEISHVKDALPASGGGRTDTVTFRNRRFGGKSLYK